MKKYIIITFVAIFLLGSSHSAFAASRYWVGGSGTWDNTAGTKWAITSGGTGGQTVPSSSDDVFFDANSGAANVTGTSLQAQNCHNLDFTGFTGTFDVSNSLQPINIFGSLVLKSGVAFSAYTINFSSTATGNTIVTNGVTLSDQNNGLVTFNSTSGSWSFLDNASVGQIVLTGGSLATNGNTITSNGGFLVTGSNTKSLSLGTSTILIGGAEEWGVIATNTTMNATSSLIEFNNTSSSVAASFTGAGFTYNNVWFNRGGSTAANTITNSDTFNDFKDTGTGAHLLSFTVGTTQTFNTFEVSGSAGHIIKLDSSSTGTYNLVKAIPGIISSDYLNIQHSIATPANTWYAGNNSINNQGVTTAGSGWIFSTPPSPIQPADDFVFGSGFQFLFNNGGTFIFN